MAMPNAVAPGSAGSISPSAKSPPLGPTKDKAKAKAPDPFADP